MAVESKPKANRNVTSSLRAAEMPALTPADPAPVTATLSRMPLMVRAKAPLRISFAGGGTDFSSYYDTRGGAVLASTVNRYTYITMAPRNGDHTISISSLDYDLMVKYHLDEEPIYNGVLDLVKAAIRRFVPSSNSWGLDVYLQSDAPAGSGLGGSSALTLAVVGGLSRLLGISLDPAEQAEMAFQIERLDLKISGGWQDQYEIAYGGFNFIEFSRDYTVVNPLRIDRGVLSDLEYHLMLCYTGQTRLSAGVIDRQEQYVRESRPETMEGLRAVHRLAVDMKNALLRGRLYDVGEMLHQEWVNKKKLNPHVTTPLIDEMYAVARASGAVGGKLLGAGAGGYLLLFCEVNRKRQVREALERFGGQLMNFSFVEGGVQVWSSEWA